MYVPNELNNGSKLRNDILGNYYLTLFRNVEKSQLKVIVKTFRKLTMTQKIEVSREKTGVYTVVLRSHNYKPNKADRDTYHSYCIAIETLLEVI